MRNSMLEQSPCFLEGAQLDARNSACFSEGAQLDAQRIYFTGGNQQRFDVSFVPLRHRRLYAGGAAIDLQNTR